MELKNIWLFRMVHIDNVEYILQNGMFTKHHSMADPNYINIGDTTLIVQRNDYLVKIKGYGKLGDYIPFYFGPLSPMLLNIKTGYRGVTKREQSDIVYICCRLDLIIDYCKQWCFTDGHAKDALTSFFNNLDSLDQVDWDIVSERIWKNTEDDFDRMRRKQAEFLVKDSVPVSSIGRIIVYNEERKLFVQDLIEYYGLNIPVRINPMNKYYY